MFRNLSLWGADVTRSPKIEMLAWVLANCSTKNMWDQRITTLNTSFYFIPSSSLITFFSSDSYSTSSCCSFFSNPNPIFPFHWTKSWCKLVMAHSMILPEQVIIPMRFATSSTDRPGWDSHPPPHNGKGPCYIHMALWVIGECLQRKVCLWMVVDRT